MLLSYCPTNLFGIVLTRKPLNKTTFILYLFNFQFLMYIYTKLNQIMTKKILNTNKAPAPVGPYNQSVLAGNTLYISGQIAIDSSSGDLITHDIKAETRQVMKNIGYILENATMSYENIVKCSVFVADMKMYEKINEVYASFFDERTAPARELVEVANLPKYVNVEISCIAVK